MAVPTAELKRAHTQRGVALVTALLVVALATVTAVAMASRQQLEVRRTSNLLQGDQAYIYAQAVEDWARVALKRDKDKQVDKLDDNWAQRLSPIAVPGGQVTGFVLDLQGRFNLNNLGQIDPNTPITDNPHFKYFQRLLRVLGLNDQLVLAVVDWIDADFDTRYPDGAEDDFYLSAKLPYRAANRPFQSISELRLVKGFDAATWNKLAPYICALPGPDLTALNVNTAAAPLLQALSEQLSPQDAQTLVEQRGTSGYKTLQEFLQSDVLAARPVEGAIVGVNSMYFLARSDIIVGGARTQVFSVLRRGENGALTLARTQGIW